MELKTILIIIGAVAFIGITGWNFRDNSEDAVFKPLRLFPRWVKYVGLIWFILSFILSIIFSLVMDNEFTFDGKNYIGVQSMAFGLLLICFSRDKIEDEMTNMIRLKSFYRSAFIGFAVVLFINVLHILTEDKTESDSFQLIGMVLGLYLMDFYLTKSKVRK